MTAAVPFAFYAAAAALAAPPLLRGPWATRSPQLAITLWLVLPVSWVTAVVLAILAATTPSALTWAGSPRASGRVLHPALAISGRHAIAAAGLVLAGAVLLRAAGCVARELHRGWRGRREQAVMVAAAGRPGPEPGVAIVDRDVPAVYCMPRGRYRIVVSSGALAALTPAQLRAVLAHERAHLRFRHHLLLSVATALSRAFPRVPLLKQAQSQLAALAEMAADDTAARGHHREDLAAALVVLGSAGARADTLAASGPQAIARLHRILGTRRPRHRCARLAAVAGLIAAAAIAGLPLVLAACGIAGQR